MYQTVNRFVHRHFEEYGQTSRDAAAIDQKLWRHGLSLVHLPPYVWPSQCADRPGVRQFLGGGQDSRATAQHQEEGRQWLFASALMVLDVSAEISFVPHSTTTPWNLSPSTILPMLRLWRTY